MEVTVEHRLQLFSSQGHWLKGNDDGDDDHFDDDDYDVAGGNNDGTGRWWG